MQVGPWAVGNPDWDWVWGRAVSHAVALGLCCACACACSAGRTVACGGTCVPCPALPPTCASSVEGRGESTGRLLAGTRRVAAAQRPSSNDPAEAPAGQDGRGFCWCPRQAYALLRPDCLDGKVSSIPRSGSWTIALCLAFRPPADERDSQEAGVRRGGQLWFLLLSVDAPNAAKRGRRRRAGQPSPAPFRIPHLPQPTVSPRQLPSP